MFTSELLATSTEMCSKPYVALTLCTNSAHNGEGLRNVLRICGRGQDIHVATPLREVCLEVGRSE